jgi:Na+/proline symporter
MPAKGPSMLSTAVTALILFLTLGSFFLVGLRTGADRTVDQFAVARGSQSGTALGLSFFASGVGSWILFSAPEVGATGGIAAAVGYGVGVVLPLVGLLLVGGRLRTLLPEGHDLAQFVRLRFGPTLQGYVLLISMLYMFTALAAELTAVSSVLGRISDLDPRIGIVAVAAVTAVYTAVGGLRASIGTDRWQSWLLFALVVVIGGWLVLRALDLLESGTPTAAEAGAASPAQVATAALAVDWSGIEAGVTVAIAVTATTLFHNGYWQRVWAARDLAALRRGAILGSLTRFPVVVAAGCAGVAAAALALDPGSPPAPFFALVAGGPTWLLITILVLTLTLIASTADTLQNGIAAAIAVRAPRLGITGARVLTVVATLIPTVIAFQGFSVLRLFLIADLFCAATLVPVLLGLWRRTTRAAALAGAIAGLVSAAAYGFVVAGFDPGQALAVSTFADGLTLGPFAAALLGSGLVTFILSLLTPKKAPTMEKVTQA